MTVTAFTQEDYAPFGSRLVAFVVDSVLLGIATTLVMVAMTVARGGEMHLEGIGAVVPWVVIGFVWDVLWIAGPARAKPGQRIAGFLVLRADGSRVDLQQALIRAGVRYASFFLFVLGFIVNAATIAASPRRQALHDMFASTVCVRREVVAGAEDTSVQHIPTAAQRARPVAAPADSEATRHQGPFL